MKIFRIESSPGNWVVWFGILVILGTWLITLRVAYEDRNLELLRTRQETENLSFILERHIHETFSRVESSLFSFRRRFENGANTGEMHIILNNLVTVNPDLFNLISIIDSRGNVLVTDKKKFRPTYSGDRPFFIYHKENKGPELRIWSPLLGRVTGKWYIPVSLRLQNADGRFKGILLASVNPKYFSMIFQRVNLGYESLVYLADFNGIVYSGMLGGKDLGLDKIISSSKLAGILAKKTGYSGIDVSILDGVERVKSRAFIQDRSMFVSVGVSLDECLGHWKNRFSYLIAAQLLISLIIFVFIFRLRQAIISRDAVSAELDEFFSTSLDLLCIADLEGNFKRVNREWEKILGYSSEELEKRKFLEFVHQDDMQVTLDAMKRLGEQEKVLNFTNRYRCRDGSYRYIEWRSIPHGELIYAAARDITDRKRSEEEREKLQEQLNQSRKMESIGRLAGGVAHDFNNMLGAIFGYTELSLRKLDPGHPVYRYLEDIKKAAERSASLTAQLLAFARRQTVAPKVLDLNETVEGMLKMLRQIIGEDMELEWISCTNPVIVKMDTTQVDQILINLCVNARDAITGTGRVIIETGRMTFDAAYCAVHEGTVPGEYVLLAVSDNGHGMDKDTIEHLFEPFFTTKSSGSGTGLGLATVYGIVKQNGGFIDVYSEPGAGTTVRIYLPEYSASPDKSSAAVIKTMQYKGNETILLVEDEPLLLEINREILEQIGYTVLSAATPGDAVNLAEEYKGKIDLLITDVIMPEMNGRDLASKIKSMHPCIKVIFMSGYTDNVIAHHGVLEEGVQFIQKPFSLDTLAGKVKETLSDK